jgi:hypothetical protein
VQAVAAHTLGACFSLALAAVPTTAEASSTLAPLTGTGRGVAWESGNLLNLTATVVWQRGSVAGIAASRTAVTGRASDRGSVTGTALIRDTVSAARLVGSVEETS